MLEYRDTEGKVKIVESISIKNSVKEQVWNMDI